jgi:hypothetical protein
MGGGEQRTLPLGDNFAPGGQILPLGAKLIMGVCSFTYGHRYNIKVYIPCVSCDQGLVVLQEKVQILIQGFIGDGTGKKVDGIELEPILFISFWLKFTGGKCLNIKLKF